MSLAEFSRDGAVALVRLNRPPVNALSEELSQDLAAAFGECEDPSIRAVVVTGQPHFAAGADITGFQAAFDAGNDDRLASTLVDTIWKLESLEKPTIAAIHGYALGGGLELSMGCDFRFLSEDAKVGQPEIALGLIPGAGGTQRLQRLVGFQRCKELSFSGRHVGAEEALAIGIADEVHPTDDLLDNAMESAAKWATKATRAIAAAKKAVNDGYGEPMRTAIQVEADQFNTAFRTNDAKEGVAAFLGKRKAEFTGS